MAQPQPMEEFQFELPPEEPESDHWEAVGELAWRIIDRLAAGWPPAADTRSRQFGTIANGQFQEMRGAGA